MNSHEAASIAKNELPILHTDKTRGDKTVYRRIKALTYHYHPVRFVTVELEHCRYSQWNIWTNLESIEPILSCDDCPDKGQDRKLCGACKHNILSKTVDNFTCRNCATCANFKNNCMGWNDNKICIRYGNCTECMNNDEDMCCDICVYCKEREVNEDEDV